MANINFPSSPTDGQTYTFGTFTWKWVAATGTWDAISTSLSPPYGPSGAVQYNAAGAFGGATAFTSDAAGNVVIGATGSLTYNPGASGGVLYTNGSKVVTSGTALTFDGTNLGVGTSSPTSTLQIKGGSKKFALTDTAITDTNYNTFRIQATAQNVFGLTVGSETTTTGQVFLDGSGNLGLGVTPSAWGSGFKAIQVGAGLSPSVSYVNGFDAASNAYYDGSNWKYIYSSYTAGLYEINTSASSCVHKWYSAAAGTANNNISFGDPKMTLDASGNLGVGVASPGYKLDVGGAARIQNDSGLRIAGTTSVDLATTASGFNIDAFSASAAIILKTQSTERARIDSSGNFIHQVNGTAPTLGTNSTMSFELTSNTLLKIVVRGTDGTTRNVSLTLA